MIETNNNSQDKLNAQGKIKIRLKNFEASSKKTKEKYNKMEEHRKKSPDVLFKVT